MKRKGWRDKPWRASEQFRELFRGRSGNEVNGLGEPQSRRPKHVFWLANSSTGPFGELQDTVVARHNSVRELQEVYENPDRGPRTPPPASTRVERSPEAWATLLRERALHFEADQVGFARMDPQWVYEGCPQDLPHVIVIAVAMDHQRSEHLPITAQHPDWAHETAVQYNRGSRAAKKLARWIAEQGYRARPHAGPWVGSLNLIPAAIAAGMGELGKHGSLINRELGSSFRLAAVETDMPVAPFDGPDVFGADDFCLNCQVCTNACPPQAIATDKQMVRGVKKWYVDFDRCIGYFNETYGCAICIAVCPWSTPGRAPRLAEKWTNRRRNAPPEED
jgi:epoxyqueuosine reductase QueG